MRISGTWGVALVAGCALAALAGCSRDGGTASSEDAKAVQVYEVPPAQLQSVQHALHGVLAVGETGSVSNSGGRLVVLAPASTQASIGKAIESLSRQPADAGPASEAPLRLRFWLLESTTEAGSRDPRLASLKPALDEASKGLGLQGFTLQGFTDVLASPGKSFNSEASNVIVDGIASRSADGVMLSVNVRVAHASGNWTGLVRTEALLEPGQFLVLSSSAGEDGRMRLIVAQAQLPTGKA